MKNLIAIFLSVLFVTISYSQTDQNNSKEIKIEKLHIEVTVDSAEELDATFKLDEIKQILDEIEDGEEISFKIICNGEVLSNGVKSNMTYKVNGNSENSESFLKSVEKIKKAAIKYYKRRSND